MELGLALFGRFRVRGVVPFVLRVLPLPFVLTAPLVELVRALRVPVVPVRPCVPVEEPVRLAAPLLPVCPAPADPAPLAPPAPPAPPAPDWAHTNGAVAVAAAKNKVKNVRFIKSIPQAKTARKRPTAISF